MIKTSANHWDCECGENYIHNKDEDTCLICHCERDDQPASRQCEVDYYEALAGLEKVNNFLGFGHGYHHMRDALSKRLAQLQKEDT
jgi:hypothetical protein